MNSPLHLYTTCKHTVNDSLHVLSNLGSITRILLWAAFFFSMVVVYAQDRSQTDSPALAPLQAFHTIVNGSPDPYVDTQLAPETLRIAVIGSSEIFDFENFKYSLGHSLTDSLPQNSVSNVQVIQRVDAAMSLNTKRRNVEQAVELKAGLIILSIPLAQLQHPAYDIELFKDDESSIFKTVAFRLLKDSQNPIRVVDSTIASVAPEYRTNIALVIHPPANDAPAATGSPIEADTAQDNESIIPVSIHDDLLETRLFEDYSSISPDLIGDMFRFVTEPALSNDVPVILFLTPVRLSPFSEEQKGKIRNDSNILDALTLSLDEPNLKVINTIANHNLESESFRDLYHIIDFAFVLPPLLEEIQSLLLQTPPESPESDHGV